MPSNGEVDDKSSNGSRAALNHHLIFSNSPKKRRLIEATDVGHKFPEHKKPVEPDVGLPKKLSQRKNAPKKLHPSTLDGNLLNLYDNDVMSDGPSFANLEEDDAFGFDN
jgi:hypothetical protein